MGGREREREKTWGCHLCPSLSPMSVKRHFSITLNLLVSIRVWTHQYTGEQGCAVEWEEFEALRTVSPHPQEKKKHFGLAEVIFFYFYLRVKRWSESAFLRSLTFTLLKDFFFPTLYVNMPSIQTCHGCRCLLYDSSVSINLNSVKVCLSLLHVGYPQWISQLCSPWECVHHIRRIALHCVCVHSSVWHILFKKKKSSPFTDVI